MSDANDDETATDDICSNTLEQERMDANDSERSQQGISERMAAATAIAMGAHFVNTLLTSSSAAVSSIVSVAACSSLVARNVPKKKSGRYFRDGALHDPDTAFWHRVDQLGDDSEFLHFTSMTRKSFNELVNLCAAKLLSDPIRPIHGKREIGAPRPCDIRRRKFSPRDIIAMTLRHLLSTAENKDIEPQFGAVSTAFSDYVLRGMQVIVEVLYTNDRTKVWWHDMDIEYLQRCANRTRSFTEVENIVFTVDGFKLRTKNDENPRLQNRDYSGWYHDVFRCMVCVYDPFGKIIDAAVNMPGNFHDSMSSVQGHIYEHISRLPPGYRGVSDDALRTEGSLKDRILKASAFRDDEDNDTPKSTSLIHLRQPAEWGNNYIVSNFRRLKTELPTDHISRGWICWACILLSNWRTETMDRNQIDTYFSFVERTYNNSADTNVTEH